MAPRSSVIKKKPAILSLHIKIRRSEHPPPFLLSRAKMWRFLLVHGRQFSPTMPRLVSDLACPSRLARLFSATLAWCFWCIAYILSLAWRLRALTWNRRDIRHIQPLPASKQNHAHFAAKYQATSSRDPIQSYLWLWLRLFLSIGHSPTGNSLLRISYTLCRYYYCYHRNPLETLVRRFEKWNFPRHSLCKSVDKKGPWSIRGNVEFGLLLSF